MNDLKLGGRGWTEAMITPIGLEFGGIPSSGCCWARLMNPRDAMNFLVEPYIEKSIPRRAKKSTSFALRDLGSKK